MDPLGTAKRCIPSWSPRSFRFLVDFSFQLRPPKTKKTLIFHWFFKVFSKIGLWKVTSILEQKNHQKTTKNQPKIHQKSILWASWGRLGRVSGRLGRVLRRLGRALARLGGILGASWRVLARLGASWARLEPQKPSRASKKTWC